MNVLSGVTVDLAPLISRIGAGDESAFVELVAQWKPMVFRWAVALTGDTDDAEDVAQEVFVRVHGRLPTYRGEGSFAGWLYRITRRVALRMRSRLRIRVPPHAAANDVYVTDPGARVDRERAVALVRTIAETLPFRQREVFMLCDLEGRSPAEAAVLLGMKDVSVRASLFKARAAIRSTIITTHPRFREHPQ